MPTWLDVCPRNMPSANIDAQQIQRARRWCRMITWLRIGFVEIAALELCIRWDETVARASLISLWRDFRKAANDEKLATGWSFPVIM